MSCVHEVKLELVRPGPPFNQLLSPLTPYMALCGDGSPVTFHIDFEHRRLLNRLERISYVTQNPNGGYDPVPNQLREAELLDLGRDMGEVLARIPSLNGELSRALSNAAASDGPSFVHLRIVMSGSELSILPLELARAPQSFPGEGLDLSLQGNQPIVITRETRRSRPLPTAWDVAEPNILLVSAAPEDLWVPIHAHERLLRAAIEPWVDWPKDEESDRDPPETELEVKRKRYVDTRLTVLRDASIEAIYDVCAKRQFTHIHILAHGDRYNEAGEQRFGIALCADPKPNAADQAPREKNVVSGKQLAQALRAEDENGNSRSQPQVVTLATCDSGNQGSVLVPGGSIAHDLQAAGIPWIFASQFPLTTDGSNRMTEVMYPRLLRGDDPRQVLYELRRCLSMNAPRGHDWASIVAYSSVTPDFDQQVARFHEQQTVHAINVQMARADNLVLRSDEHTIGTISDRVDSALERAKVLLERWQRRMPNGNLLHERTARSNCYGIKGSTFKRMALLNALMAKVIDNEDEKRVKQEQARHELNDAREAYRRAMDEWVTEEARFNWTASQFLSLSAVTGLRPDSGIFAVCWRLAERDLESHNRTLRAWAHATLAELELLRLFGAEEGLDTTAVRDKVVHHCNKIIEINGPDSFQVESTRRQFKRYADGWYLPDEDLHRSKWKKISMEIAEAAVQTLKPRSPSQTETIPCDENLAGT